eukprot:XP_001704548.1 Hypothetical protein GL50803_27190 [Giardia lamblia ATCC 50803]
MNSKYFRNCSRQESQRLVNRRGLVLCIDWHLVWRVQVFHAQMINDEAEVRSDDLCRLTFVRYADKVGSQELTVVVDKQFNGLVGVRNSVIYIFQAFDTYRMSIGQHT